jgi:membrane protease YdiL (CAAX protease family)
VSARVLGLLVLGAAALVWLAAAELGAGVRLWTTFLLVPFPALMVLQTRLVEEPATVRRLPLYLGSALSLWVLAGVTLGVALTGGLQPAAIGLVTGDVGQQLLWAAGVILLAEGTILAGHRLGLRESPLMALLLPRTGRERVAFFGLALSAGVCEELVFRGFLITVLSAATGSLTMALLLSALAFGITHAYQEPAGAARATLLGLLLAAPVVATGSVLGAALAHAAIDVIGGYWLGPRLTRVQP